MLLGHDQISTRELIDMRKNPNLSSRAGQVMVSGNVGGILLENGKKEVKTRKSIKR